MCVAKGSFNTYLRYNMYPSILNPDIKDNSLIHSADIPATILDFAGSNKSKMNHGVSFKDVIEGKVQEHRNIIIGNSNKIKLLDFIEAIENIMQKKAIRN